MQLTAYHAKYFAYELTKRYSSNSLQKFTASLSDAQVDLNPHQVEAALFAFKSPLSMGAILADEVGLGKTIEAGILISQKWAERKRRILIIVPANLRKQWSQEISDKFFIPSLILETKSFKEVIATGNFNPFDQESRVSICSYQFAKTQAIYISRVKWDLVVIDEAHRLRSVYKTSNKIGRAIKDALAHVPKILLTATPLQNSVLELYGLVSIIDEYTFGDLKSFKTQFSRITTDENYSELRSRMIPLCKRTLRRQVKEYIKYTNRVAITEPFDPYNDEQKLYNDVSEYLQRPNVYALTASQKNLMILILRKLLASSSFAIAGTLEAFAKKLEGIVKTHADKKEEEPQLEDFLSQNYESFPEQKDEWIDFDEEEEEEERKKKIPRNYSPEELEEIKIEIEDLRRFKKLAESIKKNSKGEALFTALSKGFEKLQELGANRKAIIFTESTRTQNYLKNLLEARGYKNQIVLFNGSNNDPLSNQIYEDWRQRNLGTDRATGSKTADKRAALVDYFRNTATIMIATEAAAEGINLQFCSLVVNFDLPWNPQRIEQRIGRCHRYGQKFDVVVVNFLNNANAADQRVFQLLDEKFKLFSGVFGASDEVLGTIESGVDFEKRIVKIYQECRTTEQIQSAFDKLQLDLESSIGDQVDNTRQTLLENFDVEVHEKLRSNLHESKEYLGKFENWLWNITRFFLRDHADFDFSNNSFQLRGNPFNDSSINPGVYKIVKKNVGESTAVAKQNGVANHYRVGHPLAQKIIQQCKLSELPIYEVTFDYSNSGIIISILGNMKGKSGWLQMKQLTISSFETEDYLLLAGVTDEGIPLDAEQCQRLFSLPASQADGAYILPEQVQQQFNNIYSTQQVALEKENSERNHFYFDEQIEKMNKWADDVRTSLKFELRELERDIKTRKTEARKLINLEQKVKEQRFIKDLEKKLAERRQNLYKSEDDIDKKKERLLDEIEARMKQGLQEEHVFTIKWKAV